MTTQRRFYIGLWGSARVVLRGDGHWHNDPRDPIGGGPSDQVAYYPVSQAVADAWMPEFDEDDTDDEDGDDLLGEDAPGPTPEAYAAATRALEFHRRRAAELVRLGRALLSAADWVEPPSGNWVAEQRRTLERLADDRVPPGTPQ